MKALLCSMLAVLLWASSVAWATDPIEPPRIFSLHVSAPPAIGSQERQNYMAGLMVFFPDGDELVASGILYKRKSETVQGTPLNFPDYTQPAGRVTCRVFEDGKGKGMRAVVGVEGLSGVALYEGGVTGVFVRVVNPDPPRYWYEPTLWYLTATGTMSARDQNRYAAVQIGVDGDLNFFGTPGHGGVGNPASQPTTQPLGPVAPGTQGRSVSDSAGNVRPRENDPISVRVSMLTLGAGVGSAGAGSGTETWDVSFAADWYLGSSLKDAVNLAALGFCGLAAVLMAWRELRRGDEDDDVEHDD